jgi:hypothetical protein
MTAALEDVRDAAFDARYAAALRAADPVAAVRALCVEAGIAIAAEDARFDDGVRVAALVVARLRFERIVRGDPALARAFDAEPAAFARAFKAYHAATAPTATWWTRARSQR